MKKFPINYYELKDIVDTGINPEIKQIIVNSLPSRQSGYMSEEAWMDFIIGIILMSLIEGYLKVY